SWEDRRADRKLGGAAGVVNPDRPFVTAVFAGEHLDGDAPGLTGFQRVDGKDVGMLRLRGEHQVLEGFDKGGLERNFDVADGRGGLVAEVDGDPFRHRIADARGVFRLDREAAGAGLLALHGRAESAREGGEGEQRHDPHANDLELAETEARLHPGSLRRLVARFGHATETPERAFWLPQRPYA